MNNSIINCQLSINSAERYGYNGMEQDDYLKENNQFLTTNPAFTRTGTGNSYTTEFRELDTRIGRWWSQDPKPTVFESRYAAFGNNPVLNFDPNGDWYWVVNSNKWSSVVTNQFINSTPKIRANKMESSLSRKLERQLNGYANIWSDKNSPHYAP